VGPPSSFAKEICRKHYYSNFIAQYMPQGCGYMLHMLGQSLDWFLYFVFFCCHSYMFKSNVTETPETDFLHNSLPGIFSRLFDAHLLLGAADEVVQDGHGS